MMTSLRQQGLYVINVRIEELERKLAEAEAKWQACDGSASIDRLKAAFYNRIYLKETVGKELAEVKRMYTNFETGP